MLVFPSLGSQAEVSQNRPKDSECPWNIIMYPETPVTSIYFLTQVPEDATLDTLSADNKRVHEQPNLTSGPRPTGSNTDH
jgi:hypothetical protein